MKPSSQNPAVPPAASTLSGKGGPIRSKRRQSQQDSGRTHEENQERAYIAASRRSDRSIEARLESARRASEIHKKRCGRGLRITEEAVLNEEMYEEEDPDYEQRLNRIRDFRMAMSTPHQFQHFQPYPQHMAQNAAPQYNNSPSTPSTPSFADAQAQNNPPYASFIYPMTWAGAPLTPMNNAPTTPGTPLSPGGYGHFVKAEPMSPAMGMNESVSSPAPANTHIFLPPTQFSQHSDGTVSRKDSKFDFDTADPEPPVEMVALDSTPFDIFNFDYADDVHEDHTSSFQDWVQYTEQTMPWDQSQA